MLGHPVGHSLSPVLHRAAYARLGLDWSFEAVDVVEADLPGYVRARGREPGWRGLALTMPLKRAVLALLDRADEHVGTVGAANTLLWEADGSRSGANTDVPGLVAALTAAGVGSTGTGRRPSVVLLGGGATAASAVAALAALGLTRVNLRVRDPARASGTVQVARRVGVQVDVCPLDDLPGRPDGAGSASPGLVLSTLPSAVADSAVPDALLVAREGSPPPVVVDVVYDPWPSPLLRRAAAAGARTVTGVDLLVAQAVEQVAVMTGRRVEPALLHRAAALALRDRAGPAAG